MHGRALQSNTRLNCIRTLFALFFLLVGYWHGLDVSRSVAQLHSPMLTSMEKTHIADATAQISQLTAALEEHRAAGVGAAHRVTRLQDEIKSLHNDLKMAHSESASQLLNVQAQLKSSVGAHAILTTTHADLMSQHLELTKALTKAQSSNVGSHTSTHPRETSHDAHRVAQLQDEIKILRSDLEKAHSESKSSSHQHKSKPNRIQSGSKPGWTKRAAEAREGPKNGLGCPAEHELHRHVIDVGPLKGHPFMPEGWPFITLKGEHATVEVMGAHPDIAKGDFSSCRYFDVVVWRRNRLGEGCGRCRVVTIGGTSLPAQNGNGYAYSYPTVQKNATRYNQSLFKKTDYHNPDWKNNPQLDPPAYVIPKGDPLYDRSQTGSRIEDGRKVSEQVHDYYTEKQWGDNHENRARDPIEPLELDLARARRSEFGIVAARRSDFSRGFKGPPDDQFKNRNAWLPRYLNDHDSIKEEATKLIEKQVSHDVDQGEKSVLVMCTNGAHLAMVLNFFCSLKANHIGVPRHIVFVTHANVAQQLNEAGITAYQHDGLGTMYYDLGGHKTTKYGDGGWQQMMLLKSLSVHVVLEAGYDVLFQDADLTWVKSPWVELQANALAGFETQWMEDGARMTRFAPFYANSGFFFLQRSVSTRWFWDHVVMESGMVAVFRSQQAMTTWLLNTHHTRLGMTVLMLPYDKYVSGAFLNGKIGRFPTVETSDAVVLHFCWTNSKIEKAALMVVRDSAFIPLKHIVGGVPEAHWNEHPWEEICLAGGSLGAHLFNNSYEDALAAAQQADREVKAEVYMKQEETYRKQKSHASRFAKHSKKRL